MPLKTHSFNSRGKQRLPTYCTKHTTDMINHAYQTQKPNKFLIVLFDPTSTLLVCEQTLCSGPYSGDGGSSRQRSQISSPNLWGV